MQIGLSWRKHCTDKGHIAVEKACNSLKCFAAAVVEVVDEEVREVVDEEVREVVDGDELSVAMI